MTNLRSWEGREACSHAGISGYLDPAPPPSPHGHALPGDGPVWPRDREVDVESVKLEIALNVPNKSANGTVTHSVRAFNDGLRQVSFDAIDMTIEGVSVDGAAAPFIYDDTSLQVALSPQRRRGDVFAIAITYSVQPRMGLYFIAPDESYPEKPFQVWSQCQDEDTRFWIPCIDFLGQKQSFELLATVPGAWFALSNGVLLAETSNADGTKTFHWRQEKPLPTYLFTLAAGEFARIDGSSSGLTIDYFVEQADREDGERTFKRTPEMITFFERITGVPFPWDKYSQIVVRDFVFGGMENTSATTMTRNILLDRKAAVDFTTEDLVAHELAHMWWGDLLTCRDWSHGWLNEGFATYMELLWDEEKRGLDEYRQGVIVNTEAYLEEGYRRPIVSKVFREPIDIFDRHLYEKGCLVLHTLRGVLGDDGFFRSIQRYCREHQHTSVTTEDLIAAILAETGRNLEWFFDQWVFRPGHPSFKVSWSWDDATSNARVHVKQTQKTDDGAAIFRVPVVIDFTTARKRPRAFPVEVTEAEQSFVFPLPGKPDLCRFDPYNHVLKELDFEKSTAELRLQLRDDDDITGRQQAASGLGKKGGADAVAALEDAVTRDRFWGVQVAAAKALGMLRSEAARDALVRALKVRHPKARRAVIAALGEFRGEETVFEAVAPFARRDRSWFVESEAHRSIGKLRVARSFDLLVAGMKRESFRQVVRQGCIDGFVELRDERGLAELTAAATYGAAQNSRAPATGAIGRLGAHFEARKADLGESLSLLLDDPDFRVRMAAARALRALKDPSAATQLDRMASRELDGRAVRAARQAALDLRKGAETTSEVKNLRDDFEKLRDENTKLRDRLERLEAKKK